MKRLLLASVAILGLSLPTLSQAGSWQGSTNWSSQSRWQNNRGYNNDRRLVIAAHELSQTAYATYKEAQRVAYSYRGIRRNDLLALSNLSQAAERFHRQVESLYRNPRRTARDFNRLMDAIDYAYPTLQDLYGTRRLNRYLSDLHQDVHRLMDLYSGYGERLDRGCGFGFFHNTYNQPRHGRYNNRHDHHGGPGGFVNTRPH